MSNTEFEETIFDNEKHAQSTFLWVWSGHMIGFPPGSFAESLIESFINADGDNHKRLASVYPMYEKAWEKCKSGQASKEWFEK